MAKTGRSGKPKTRRKLSRGGAGGVENAVVGELIAKHPKVLEVLDRYGVTFCAGCYITLFAHPQKAAAYHAVENKKNFLRDLARAVAASKAGGRS